MRKRESESWRMEVVQVQFTDKTRGICVNDSVPLCCLRGVGFESGQHCFILETLKMVHTAAMSGM